MSAHTHRNRSMAGFTMIELMITISVMSAVMLGVYFLNLTLTKSSLHQESMTVLQDEGRMALQRMTRVFRMADEQTLVTISNGEEVEFGDSAVSNLQFRIVDDTDGNGVAINQDMSVGLAPPIRFAVDNDDANGDGFTATQLVELDEDGNFRRILAEHLAPNGVSFQPAGGGIQITLVLSRPAAGLRPPANVTVSQLVTTRN